MGKKICKLFHQLIKIYTLDEVIGILLDMGYSYKSVASCLKDVSKRRYKKTSGRKPKRPSKSKPKGGKNPKPFRSGGSTQFERWQSGKFGKNKRKLKAGPVYGLPFMGPGMGWMKPHLD